MLTTGFIHVAYIPRLEKVISKLQKRAKKLGLAPVTCEPTGNRNLVEEEGFDGAKVFSEYIEYALEGEVPTLESWRIVGVVSADTAGVMLPVNFEVSIPDAYITYGGQCDHCKQDRRRVRAYLVEKDGQFLWVGSSCVKDFCPSFNGDPHALLAFLSQLADPRFFEVFAEESERELGSGCGGAYLVTLPEYLRLVSECISLSGWVSGSRAYDTGDVSTASQAWYALVDSHSAKAHREAVKSLPPTNKDYAAEIAAAIEWAKGNQGANDYSRTIRLIADRGLVGHDSKGYAASILPAYRREVAEKAENATAKPSEHLGDIKDRLTLDVAVESVRVFEGAYGQTCIHRFRDSAGNLLVWFASYSAAWFGEGDEVKITGTVKKHDEYKGVKQTVLTRVKEVA